MNRLPWFERTAESPEPPPDGECVLLRVPETIAWAERTSLPVSGSFQLGPALEELPGGDPFQALTLFVVEASTARSFAVRPMSQAVAVTSEPGPAGTRRGYFHVDAFLMGRWVASPGTYHVSAFLGGLQCAPVPVHVVGAGVHAPGR